MVTLLPALTRISVMDASLGLERRRGAAYGDGLKGDQVAAALAEYTRPVLVGDRFAAPGEPRRDGWVCASGSLRRTVMATVLAATTGGHLMAWSDDVDEIRRDIAELRAFLDAQQGVPAEARAAGLAAMVNAKATLLAVETAHGFQTGIRDDVAMPLMGALGKFTEPANRLAAALGRLPDR